MPSGMMMMRQLPTNKPVPIADIVREWLCDRPKDKGSEPARKELWMIHISLL